MRLVFATVAALLLAACGEDPPELPMGDGGTTVPDGAPAGEACATHEDCSNDVFCDGRERCRPGDPEADGRGCVVAASPPCTVEQSCNEEVDACETECDRTSDADGDGHDAMECGGDDCDDADPNRYPGNSEVCDPDDHDEDCDPSTFGIRDADSDGFPDARCCNVDGDEMNCGTDCDDTLSVVHPTEAESCDGLDNDCDETVDEGVLTRFWVDGDGDGHGDEDAIDDYVDACEAPDGYADSMDDCDDENTGVNPGVAEACDASDPPVDENCDGVVNPASLCDCTGSGSRDCPLSGACATGTQTCLDGHWGMCSIAPVSETCNGVDDDCDGETDEGVTITCYGDSDGDTYAAGGTASSEKCSDPGRPEVGGCPAGFTNRAPFGDDVDCNGADSGIHPGAFEECDGKDQDCDGDVDETVSVTCYEDGDGDTYAAAGTLAEAQCPVPGRGFVGGCPVGFTNRAPIDGTDCRDSDSSFNPGAPELCDGAMEDEDCDSMSNEGCTCSGSDTRGCTESGVCASGTQTCMSGSWGACSISPTPETCNGLNDDCDSEGADEDFACVRGSTASCSVCGRAGTKTCLDDCSGFGTCRAEDEACNACDDDSDGVVDEGFTCPAGGTIDPCTTACGTTGVGTCNATCDDAVGGTCFAATETCNYCDDDGDGTTQDESSMATVDRTTVPQCDMLDLYSGASCAMTGLPSQEEVQLVSRTSYHDRGAAWVSTPQGVGWGVMELSVLMRVRKGDSPPADGWALVLSDGGSGLVGAEGGSLAVPTTREGLAIEWRYYDNNPNVEQPDFVTVRRLTGAGSGTVIRKQQVPDSSLYLGSSSSGDVYQRLFIRYRPRNASDSDEVLQISTTPFTSFVGGFEGFIKLYGGSGAPPGYLPVLDHELESGRPLDIGVTAANGGRRADVYWQIGMGPSPGVGPRSPMSFENVCF